jgi:hypothetical protein
VAKVNAPSAARLLLSLVEISKFTLAEPSILVLLPPFVILFSSLFCLLVFSISPPPPLSFYPSHPPNAFPFNVLYYLPNKLHSPIHTSTMMLSHLFTFRLLTLLSLSVFFLALASLTSAAPVPQGITITAVSSSSIPTTSSTDAQSSPNRLKRSAPKSDVCPGAFDENGRCPCTSKQEGKSVVSYFLICRVRILLLIYTLKR